MIMPMLLSWGLALAGGDEQTSSGLKEEWVALDMALIGRMRAALAYSVMHVETLKEQLDSPRVDDDRLIGFGARRVVLAMGGGYTTIGIHLLVA